MSAHVEGMLTRHFAGELDHAEQDSMRAHLHECSRCREEYDALATLLRVAADSEPTGAELDRWQDDLEVRLGWTAPPPPRAPSPFRSWLLAPLTAACVLALVCGALLALLPREGTPPEVQLRGANLGNRPATLAGLELTAVTQGPGGAPVVRRLADGDTARLDEYLQLRYRVHGQGLGFLYLFGLDARMRTLDYYPRPSASRSIAIQEALSPRSVGRSIRLDKRHQPGALRVVALFSPEPLERPAVHAWIEELVLTGFTPDHLPLEALGPGVVAVVRVIFLDGGPW